MLSRSQWKRDSLADFIVYEEIALEIKAEKAVRRYSVAVEQRRIALTQIDEAQIMKSLKISHHPAPDVTSGRVGRNVIAF